MSALATANLNPEPSLITRARNGDANAFAVLYETHKPLILGVCLKMTKNMTEAEDLTQDAFIYGFRKISTFRGDSAFSTWLHRVAVNTVLMHFRRNGKRNVSLEEPVTQDSHEAKREYGQVDERLAGCADRMALAHAISELPPGYRMIFLMHEVQGCEHNEIARRLHCSIGNSKSQLHKAKLRMRELLAHLGYTHRRKAVAAKPIVLPVGVPVEVASANNLVLSSADVSPWPSNQLPENNSKERKVPVPRQPSDIALPAAYEKLRSRRKVLTDRSIVSNPGIIFPAIRQVNPVLMAESGS